MNIDSLMYEMSIKKINKLKKGFQSFGRTLSFERSVYFNVIHDEEFEKLEKACNTGKLLESSFDYLNDQFLNEHGMLEFAKFNYDICYKFKKDLVPCSRHSWIQLEDSNSIAFYFVSTACFEDVSAKNRVLSQNSW